MQIEFTLNQEIRTVDVKPNEILLHVLREKFGIKSPKSGCERGDCGTCTIILNGKTVKSCLVLAIEADGSEITTLEGLMKDGKPTKVQDKFIEKNSFQCGFCAPGMTMATTELLDNNPDPSREEVKEALSGNLCRCTGYESIIDAVIDCAKGGQNG